MTRDIIVYQGRPGKSAYQLALDSGDIPPETTLAQWLADQQGPPGNDGSPDTPEQVRDKYESNVDRNAYTDAEKGKIESLGTASTTDAEPVGLYQLEDSTATVDGYFVRSGTDSTNRRIRVVRDVFDLEHAGLVQDQDITALLSAAASNFAGNEFRIRLPRSITNLISDVVIFPVGLERFEVFSGNCSISQSAAATSGTMWRVSDPRNVFVQNGIVFKGHVDAANFTNESQSVLEIGGWPKTTEGGSIVNHADFIGATANGFSVVQGNTFAYDKIEVIGNYPDAGINLNTLVNNVTLIAHTSDSVNYLDSQSKSRGVQIGRVVETLNVELNVRYGGGLFLFALGNGVVGPTGNVKINGYELGYQQDGSEGDVSASLAKVDSLKTGKLAFDVFCLDSLQRILSAEASPGPTTDCSFRYSHARGVLKLTDLEDDGVDNYECYGNSCLSGTSVSTIETGPASTVEFSFCEFLHLKTHSNIPTYDVFVHSVAVAVNCTTVSKEVLLGNSCLAKFSSCNLPNVFTTIEPDSRDATSKPSVVSFENCKFQPGSIIENGDVRVTVSGKNDGLDLSLLDAWKLPYLRLDAAGHPIRDVKDTAETEESTLFETINRPVGWQRNGRALPQRKSGSSVSPRSSFVQLIDVDPTTCVGGLLFPQINSNAQNLGSYIWDVGESNVVIEAAITLKTGGPSQSGLMARVAGNELSANFAYIDAANGAVRFQSGQPHQGPTLSVSTTIDFDTEYVLRMECDGDSIKVFLDGLELISTTSARNQTATSFGIKNLNAAGLGNLGPTYRYLEIRPLVNSTEIVEQERRAVQPLIFPATLFAATVSKTIEDSELETSIIATGKGLNFLPANFWEPGRTVEIKARGVCSTTTGGGDITFRLLVGDVEIASITNFDIISDGADSAFELDATIICRTDGTAGTVVPGGSFNFNSSSGRVFTDLNNSGQETVIDTTAANFLNVTAKWDDGSPDLSITVSSLYISAR